MLCLSPENIEPALEPKSNKKNYSNHHTYRIFCEHVFSKNGGDKILFLMYYLNI